VKKDELVNFHLAEFIKIFHVSMYFISSSDDKQSSFGAESVVPW
jgi:hypothetical protein